ncbi:MAG: thioredoxin family protein [Chloroflexi bacterium]|nr:thioredoxin family protein [Chloroflexota bacterium]
MVCKKVTPIVDGIRRSYRGQLNVVYVDIDRGNGKKLAREHGVMGAPTILLLDSEGNQVNVLRGAESQLMLEQAVKDWMAGNATTNLD